MTDRRKGAGARPWWLKIFDSSYPHIYRFTDDHVSSDLTFMNELLSLRPGLRLLDVCCGYGRHCIPLAGAGLEVTGVDASASQLHEARRRARAAGVRVEWIRADARRFSTRRRYDRVINMFTSFGYFDTEEEDAAMMQRMATALKRGGLLMLDTLNRDFIVSHFLPTITFEIEDGHVIDTNRLDSVTGRLDARRIVCRNGRVKRMTFSIRLYTGRELVRMAESCGLEVLDVFGSFEGDRLDLDGPRVILVARKG